MLQVLSHMFCLSHSIIMLWAKHFQALLYSFQVIYSFRTSLRAGIVPPPHLQIASDATAVTVKSHNLASTVCSIFPKSVSNLTIIAGNRYGLRSKP